MSAVPLMNLADALARLSGVRSCAGGYVARCPAHSDREASLSVREGEGGRVLLKCFAGCPFEAIRDALGGRAWPRSLGLLNPTLRPVLDDAKRTEIARRVWHESKPATGTLAEIYLHARGITMPIPPTLRSHANLPASDWHVPTGDGRGSRTRPDGHADRRGP